MAAIIERHAAVGATLLEMFTLKGVPLAAVIATGQEKFLRSTSALGLTRTEGVEVWKRFQILAQDEIRDARVQQPMTGAKLAARRLCLDCKKQLYDFESDRCVACAAQRTASA